MSRRVALGAAVVAVGAVLAWAMLGRDGATSSARVGVGQERPARVAGLPPALELNDRLVIHVPPEGRPGATPMTVRDFAASYHLPSLASYARDPIEIRSRDLSPEQVDKMMARYAALRGDDAEAFAKREAVKEERRAHRRARDQGAAAADATRPPGPGQRRGAGGGGGHGDGTGGGRAVQASPEAAPAP